MRVFVSERERRRRARRRKDGPEVHSYEGNDNDEMKVSLQSFFLEVVDELVGEKPNEESIRVPLGFGVGETSIVECVFEGERAGKKGEGSQSRFVPRRGPKKVNDNSLQLKLDRNSLEGNPVESFHVYPEENSRK